jgi:NAD(P)-dependent dehydrogenase (short-subunit alcohol dehydrogenase family)
VVSIGPDRQAGTQTAGCASDIGAAEIDACLRVLDRACADPADPRWEAVREATARLYRAGKKQRKAARYAERRERERAAGAASTRHRRQNPEPEPGPGTRPLPPPRPETLLDGTRRCYVCKAGYQRVHPDYHLLCPDCAEENLARRYARCDLSGRRAVVTGGRVKIGFHVALKLLRDGAEVLVTTRFPRDAARRFAAVSDCGDWLGRLHIHGVDLLDLAAVAALLESVPERFDHLDILINNAAQTIRRPAAYHRKVRAAEAESLSGAAGRIDVRDTARAAVQAITAPTALPVPGGLSYAPGAGAHAGSGGGTVTRMAAEAEAYFPAGRTDETGEPLDLRARNSWSLRLHEVDPAEWLEVQVVNAFAPFLLTSRLRGLLEASPRPDRYVVQVSAMEGSFSRENKTVRHPHTNMAKAALNMLTRTAAADYAATGIHMNSVDTGWVTDERPHPDKTAQRAAGFRPPLDVIDGAARVYDPIVRGVAGGEHVSGLFLKDYRPVEW